VLYISAFNHYVQYHFGVPNMVTELEALEAEVDVKSAWENFRENIKIEAKVSLGYYESKKHNTRHPHIHTRTRARIHTHPH
jgi:hypothetical protein